MDDGETRRAARACPICGKQADPRFRPFCSSRCRMVDLGRWLDGRYRVATDEAPDDGDGAEPSPARER